MILKKYLGLDRRRHSRYAVAIEVEFHVWDESTQKPRTGKVVGRLSDISPAGACLQTNHTMIEGHHLLLDDDPGGDTPLILSLPSPSKGEPWNIKAQVLWYNKIESERRYQFDVGVKFVDFSLSDEKNLRTLLDSLSEKDS